MNDVVAVQLAISKLHMQALLEQPLTAKVAMQALAELDTALSVLEATNAELVTQNESSAAARLTHEIDTGRYYALFERVPVAYLITDSLGVIFEANAAAESLLNVPREMLQGKPISVFVPPADRREFRDRMNQSSVNGAWEVEFQPRGGERITVQIDMTTIPAEKPHETQVAWVLLNITPQRAVASAERMLARETAMRLEAQAAIIRLRALNVGLETMSHDVTMPLRHRVTSLLQALVPRFAQTLTCYLPDDRDRPVEVGELNYAGNVLQTVVLAPFREPGRLIARRESPFCAEDAAILQSAANGISLLSYSLSSASIPSNHPADF